MSEPPCYHEQHLVTRHCNDTKWIPVLEELQECSGVVEPFDLLSCPPGFHRISETNKEFCYQVSTDSKWDFPCFKSGGASVITDLNADDINSLINSLNKTQKSKFFWLPAQRVKIFNPVVWYIPGPNWGRQVESNNNIRTQMFFFKNCLLLDIEQRSIVTETCSKEYPSLCFYLNDLHYPAKCPHSYHAFRFMPDNGTCYGIEYSANSKGLSYDEFIETKCEKPMTESKMSNLSRFIFMKVAELNKLPDNTWCWFEISELYYNETNENEKNRYDSSHRGIVNNKGVLSLPNMFTAIPCMACEKDMIYEEATLSLEYDYLNTLLYLTIYFPSGLWKYDNNDKGIQCFSDAKGFVKVINVSDTPFIKINSVQPRDNNEVNVEKTVYVINLITDRSAQYWCEGHTQNFSLVTTTKIIANPQGNSVHAFALFVIIPIYNNDRPDLQDLCDSIINMTTTVFYADKVILMDIFEHTTEHLLVLLHLHIANNGNIKDEGNSLKEIHQYLSDKAEVELPKYNLTFVNVSSSTYCLPTYSIDYITLEWELTMIGQVTVPKQFCLQGNGLPVTRTCYGSYNTGGFWGEVVGNCNQNVEPSTTTTFLYNFMKRQTPENFTSTFLTDGLGFVFEDINIIIPADIYYLSMSLQYVNSIAQENQSLIDMGDIDNMAWVMDRVMVLNNNYLRLAQTLNSTNMILESVNDMIEMLAGSNVNGTYDSHEDGYQFAIMPQFLVQISYPVVNNITGIALIKKTKSDMFTDMTIQPLFKNTTLEYIMSIENIEIATWIPEAVLDTLRKNENDSNEESIDKSKIHIVVSIFQNDAVFQQLDKSKHMVNSRIVGVSIPGFISNLEHSVTLVFREINRVNSYKLCGYWEFQTKKTGNNPGFWTNKGCFYVKSIKGLAICKCYHMTHFGQLLDISGIINPVDNSLKYKNRKTLNIITLVGSFLSLLGTSGIWITALVFQNWRKKAGTKVLLQLSTAIAIPLLFIVLFNFDNSIFIDNNGKYQVAKDMEIVCIILGSLLHYSVLASFMWMLIIAILQFIRYVRVLGVPRPSRFMIKFTFIGWGLPLIPVAFVLAFNKENYIPDPSINDTFKGICYPNGFYLIMGVIVPICIILVINVTLFVLVIYAISRGNGKMRATDIDIVGAQLRLSIFLFFLLGLTWIFGMFSFTNNLLWSYLFCLTSSLQGFVLFIYFVICDPMTRNMWISIMKPQFLMSSSRDSVSSISSG